MTYYEEDESKYLAMSIVYKNDSGYLCCGECNSELGLTDSMLPDVCPECGEILDYSSVDL